MLQVLRTLRETGGDAWHTPDKICHHVIKFCARGAFDGQHACTATNHDIKTACTATRMPQCGVMRAVRAVMNIVSNSAQPMDNHVSRELAD